MGPYIGLCIATTETYNKYVLLSNWNLKGKFDLAEERLREHEDRSTEIIQSEEQKDKRMKKNKQSFRELRKISSVTTYV